MKAAIIHWFYERRVAAAARTTGGRVPLTRITSYAASIHRHERCDDSSREQRSEGHKGVSSGRVPTDREEALSGSEKTGRVKFGCGLEENCGMDFGVSSVK
ncbi:unnamed protein product [Rhizoctonia solani]|uniref:Uncharacterized protein n=1 Tax=Rhizoctonia solani TaxID=456999 RepID=A0A8H3C767_9AGAM|nr:unnamed protein product [Rhizoctonia solani]